MSKWHEITKLVWNDARGCYGDELDIRVRNWLKSAANELVKMEDAYEGHFNRNEYIDRILGLSPVDEPEKELFPCGCFHPSFVKCPVHYQEGKPVQDKGEWCQHYRKSATWYEREASVGSGVFNVIVHHQDKFCAVCGAPKPRPEAKTLAKKLEDVYIRCSNLMNLEDKMEYLAQEAELHFSKQNEGE